jgi:hypothetical protein
MPIKTVIGPIAFRKIAKKWPYLLQSETISSAGNLGAARFLTVVADASSQACENYNRALRLSAALRSGVQLFSSGGLFSELRAAPEFDQGVKQRGRNIGHQDSPSSMSQRDALFLIAGFCFGR